MDTTMTQIIFTSLAALMVGFAKTGIPSLGIFTVTILAIIYPAKESVGILLPMLITADIVAVTYYRKTVIWKHLISMIPWVLGGILTGFFVLQDIQDKQLSLLMGVLVLALIILHVSKEKLEEKLKFEFTQTPIFFGILGILAGFTTMVGNAAGAIMTIYLLSKGLEKKEFIGTGAWFFLTVNLIKVPFSVYLGLITLDSLTLNASMIPVILLGSFIGIKVLPLIPQKYFQLIILTLATIGAIRLIYSGL
jgi:uncharacterized membrane protein YfcA